MSSLGVIADTYSSATTDAVSIFILQEMIFMKVEFIIGYAILQMIFGIHILIIMGIHTLDRRLSLQLLYNSYYKK